MRRWVLPALLLGINPGVARAEFIVKGVPKAASNAVARDEYSKANALMLESAKACVGNAIVECVQANSYLARAALGRRNFDIAEAAAARAVAGARRLTGDERMNLLSEALAAYGEVLDARGKSAAARPVFIEAVREARIAMRIDPDLTPVFVLLKAGNNLLNLGDYRGALSAFDEVISFGQQPAIDPEAVLGSAMVWDKLDQVERAAHLYATADRLASRWGSHSVRRLPYTKAISDFAIRRGVQVGDPRAMLMAGMKTVVDRRARGSDFETIADTDLSNYRWLFKNIVTLNWIVSSSGRPLG